jgi:hypothetical protein
MGVSNPTDIQQSKSRQASSIQHPARSARGMQTLVPATAQRVGSWVPLALLVGNPAYWGRKEAGEGASGCTGMYCPSTVGSVRGYMWYIQYSTSGTSGGKPPTKNTESLRTTAYEAWRRGTPRYRDSTTATVPVPSGQSTSEAQELHRHTLDAPLPHGSSSSSSTESCPRTAALDDWAGQ